MSETTEEIPLTEEEKNAIWAAINKMQPDDEDTGVVIDEKFDGDTEKYLTTMAGCHNIPIGSESLK